jgi:catechol 2,3-dioxygenase-like lactoylglutathione lyase family enzyme
MAVKITEFRLKLYPKDYAAVRDFYEHKLGLAVVRDWDRADNDKGVMFQVGTTVLEILTPEDGYAPITGANVSWEVADVHNLWEQLKDDEAIVFALRDNAWGDTSFCIADPEGFQITFFTRST